jgi:hypothetical protein
VKFILFYKKKPFEVLIDDEDYKKIKDYTWGIDYQKKHNRYIVRSTSPKKILMHRLILNVKRGIQVDHIRHKTLDNRKCELRLCSNQQNSFNQKIRKNNTSGYKGVSFSSRDNKWRSYIVYNSKQIFLGHFNNKKNAAKAYNKKAKELFGEFANLNKI